MFSMIQSIALTLIGKTTSVFGAVLDASAIAVANTWHILYLIY